jgi:hypothetical protein
MNLLLFLYLYKKQKKWFFLITKYIIKILIIFSIRNGILRAILLIYIYSRCCS